MKTYAGEIWYQEVNGTVNMGFTKEFIHTVLTECFHITQASFVMLVKDRPMLTIETNEGLKVIRSPVTGMVTIFSTDARDFPDRLTEDTVVVSIKLKSVAVPGKKAERTKYEPTQHIDEWLQRNAPPVNYLADWEA